MSRLVKISSTIKRSLLILMLVVYVGIEFGPTVYAQTAPPTPPAAAAPTGISNEQYRVFNNDLQWFNYDRHVVASCGAGGAGNIGVAKGFDLGTNGVDRRVNLMKALMKDFSLPKPEQAAGIVGNFMHESGGIDLPPDVNEGGVKGPPRFSGGYGWAQWTGPRQRSFIAFAVKEGYMASDQVPAKDDADYAWLKQELSTNYKTTITELLRANTTDEATANFERTFEAAGVPAIAKRQGFARQALSEYNGGGATAGGGTTTGGATGGCPGTTTGANCSTSKDCATLILQMIKEGKMNAQAGGIHDLTPAAAGQKITSCPQGAVELNTSLLQLLIKLANDLQAKSPNYKLNIHNFVSPPWHSCDGAFHTKGRAADVHIDDMGGCNGTGGTCLNTAADYHKPLNHDFAQDAMSSTPPGGGLGQKQYIGPLDGVTDGRRYFEDSNHHFHVDVGAKAP